MGRCKFVQPDVVRLHLSDGEWIDVKKELNAGETRKAFGRLVKTMHFNEKAEVDPEQVGLATIVEYIVGWSFVGSDENRVEPFSEGALLNLPPHIYAEIEAAIDLHEQQSREAREARKNETAGLTKSSETSLSAG